MYVSKRIRMFAVACMTMALSACHIAEDFESTVLGKPSNRMVLAETLQGMDMVMNDIVVDEMSEQHLDMLIANIEFYKNFKNRYSLFVSDPTMLDLDTMKADWVKLRNSYKTVFFITKSYWRSYPPELQNQLRTVHENAMRVDDTVRKAFAVKDKVDIYKNMLSIGLSIAKVVIV